MASDSLEKRSPHAVEFLTAGEVARVDEDPVLERRDIWQEDTQ